MQAIELLHNGNSLRLEVAQNPVTIEWLYRVCSGLDNESLYLFVRRNPKAVYVITGLGYFSLCVGSPDEDVRVTEINGAKQESLLFSDFIAPILHRKPGLLSKDELWDLYLAQAA